MALAGSLRTMPLTDLLQWMSTARKGGVLEVERNKVLRVIEVREGRLTACSSDDPPQRLGQILLSQGKVSEETLRDALERQKSTGENLGKILVDAKAITTDDLSMFLAAQAEENLFSLFDWEDAEFRFDETRPPGVNGFPVSLRIEDILLRGLKRFDESRRIRTVFTDPGIVLRRTAKQPPAEVSRNRLASRIYESVTGDRTVAEILLHAHASEYLVLKFLFELFRNGMVEIVEVRPVASDPGAAAVAPAEPPSVPGEPPAPAPGPPRASGVPRPAAGASVEAELETARTLMQRGEHGRALDILNALYRARPSDDSLRKLVAEAETAFVEKAYRHYLPGHKVPVLLRSPETLTGENLSPVEFFLLSRVNGAWDVRSIVQIAPIREVDALRTFLRMREAGLIDLKDPT